MYGLRRWPYDRPPTRKNERASLFRVLRVNGAVQLPNEAFLSLQDKLSNSLVISLLNQIVLSWARLLGQVMTSLNKIHSDSKERKSILKKRPIGSKFFFRDFYFQQIMFQAAIFQVIVTGSKLQSADC